MKSIVDISTEVNSRFPHLLDENVVETVFEFLLKVKFELIKNGYRVAFIGKTRGESQHVPQGFIEHVVNGHVITGVSHDALWVNDAQYDFVIAANDTNRPIFDSDNDATKRRIKASPTANAVDPKWWRSNNPPVELNLDDANFPPVLEPPTSGFRLKDRDTFYRELREINAFYASPDGLRRYGGMVINDHADVEALGSWGYDLMTGKSVEECKESIRRSIEWRSKH
jgi:hypothetical protein